MAVDVIWAYLYVDILVMCPIHHALIDRDTATEYNSTPPTSIFHTLLSIFFLLYKNYMSPPIKKPAKIIVYKSARAIKGRTYAPVLFNKTH